MIAGVVPMAAVAVDASGHVPDTALWPEEAAALGRTVEKRRREFVGGRSCARRALTQLGVAPVPVLRGADREPLWPDGIVGSITHCDGYCAAVVARASEVASIGIDAEIDEPLPPGVLQNVALDAEREWIVAAPRGDICWDRLLFSAKESVFKAWFPLTKRWLDFHDVILTVDADTRTFYAHLLVPGPQVDGSPIAGFDGRYAGADGRIVTGVALAARPRSHEMLS